MASVLFVGAAPMAGKALRNLLAGLNEPRGLGPAAGRHLPRRRVFVLVPGSCHGAWCFERLEEALAAGGARALAVGLTGLGERGHLPMELATLATHVEDVVRVLEFHDLVDVTLVGFSYGGLVVTGAADHAPARITSIVYVDALVPRNNECALDVRPRLAPCDTEGTQLATPADFGIKDPALARWVAERLTPMPKACLHEKLRLGASGASIASGSPSVHCPFSRTFILASENFPGMHVAAFPRLAQLMDDPGWRVEFLDAGHDAQLTCPTALARLLLATPAARPKPPGVTRPPK